MFKLVLAVTILVAINAQTTKKPIPGGKIDIDVNTPAVVESSYFAFVMISNSINSVYAHKMGKVLKAQSQVVAGVKYYLTLEVNQTECKKDVKDLSNCAITKTEICDAVILSRPWDELNAKQLISYECKAKST